jgi:transcriptional regulator with XRE-family HTH domain
LIRLGRGWTQAELSDRSGIPIATISRWENQRISSYDADVLAAFARALKVEVGVLLELNDTHDPGATPRALPPIRPVYRPGPMGGWIG